MQSKILKIFLFIVIVVNYIGCSYPEEGDQVYPPVSKMPLEVGNKWYYRVTKNGISWDDTTEVTGFSMYNVHGEDKFLYKYREIDLFEDNIANDTTRYRLLSYDNSNTLYEYGFIKEPEFGVEEVIIYDKKVPRIDYVDTELKTLYNEGGLYIQSVGKMEVYSDYLEPDSTSIVVVKVYLNYDNTSFYYDYDRVEYDTYYFSNGILRTEGYIGSHIGGHSFKFELKGYSLR